MRTIALANGRGVALVDDEDYERVAALRWQLMAPKRSMVVYAKTCLPVSMGGGQPSMHVFLLGKKDGLEIDHVDGNGLNNQKANLRFATRSQNMANSTKQRNNRAGLKGVARDRRGGPNPYKAYARVGGKTTYLGSFPTPDLAHAAYMESAKASYGEFARAD